MVLLAGIAGLVSFGHTYELALRVGEDRWAACLIPLSVDGMILASSMTLLLDSRLGNRGGLLPWTLLLVGCVLFTQLDAGTGLALVIASFVITYPGVAPSMTLTTDLVVGSVPPEKASGTSGLATTANDLGISLGVAVIGSVGVAAYRSQIAGTLPEGLPAGAASAASDSVDGALASAAELPGALGDSLVSAAQAASTGGLNTAAIVSAVIAAVAAIISATRLRHVPPTGQAQQSTTE